MREPPAAVGEAPDADGRGGWGLLDRVRRRLIAAVLAAVLGAEQLIDLDRREDEAERPMDRGRVAWAAAGAAILLVIMLRIRRDRRGT